MKLFETNLVSRFLHRNTPSHNPKLHSAVRSIIADEGLTVTWFTVFEIRRGLEELRQLPGPTEGHECSPLGARWLRHAATPPPRARERSRLTP